MSASSRLGRLPVAGELVDRYRIVAEIAHGGMAVVYAARRVGAVHFEKLLALKMMLPHLVGEERFVHMFLDEARIAAQIQHPNVVQVFDVGTFERAPYLVMEFLRGQPLSKVLKRTWSNETPSLSREMLCAILASAAEGLHAAHEATGPDGAALGVVHRDVSPENIHVGYDGHVKVVDFGIAAARGRIASTRTGEVKGKLAYMAPEQLHKRFAIDRRTDVWALGVLAWSAFARRPLFSGDTDPDTMWNVVHKAIDDLATIDPELPPSLAASIMACLEREPPRRLSSAAELAAELRAAAHGVTAATLAAQVQSEFATERAAEDERIASVSRATVEIELPDKTEVTARSRPAWPWIAVAVAIGIGGVWMGSTMASEDESPAPAPRASEPVGDPARTSEIAARVREPLERPATEHRPRTIRLEVAPSVREVWVDGERHDERPVRAEIRGRPAEVAIVGSGRRRRTLEVDAADDGATLDLGPRRPATMREARSEPVMDAPRMDDIIRDPL